MATYFRTPSRFTARSVALTPWSQGLLLTTWPGPTAYNFDGASFTAVVLPVLGYLPFGFAAASETGLGNAWIAGYFGGAIHVSGIASATGYPYPAGTFFTGTAVASGHPYFLRTTGDVYTLVSGSIALIAGSFGEEASALTASGSTLYAALPNSSRMGKMVLVSAVSGTVTKVATPMTVPAAVAAGVSGVAVAGWDYASLVSGVSSLATSPTGLLVAAIASGTGTLMLLSGPDPAWHVTQVISGIAGPVKAAWASSGEQVLVTRTAAVDIYNLNTGTLSLGQTVSMAAPRSIAVTPDGVTAIACLPASNLAQVLRAVANVWTAGETIIVNNAPAHIVALSDTAMACAYAPGGSGGGIDWLALQSGTWQSEIAVSGLGFGVSGIAADTTGTIYAVGTTGANSSPTGHLSAVRKGGILAATTWVSGRGDAVLWEQGQIAVIDSGAR